MVRPKRETVENPPGEKRQQRRIPVGRSGKVATANPLGRTAAANRAKIKRLRVEDLPRAHPLLPRGSGVPNEANMGHCHIRNCHYQSRTGLTAVAVAKYFPKINGDTERPWSKIKMNLRSTKRALEYEDYHYHAAPPLSDESDHKNKAGNEPA